MSKSGLGMQLRAMGRKPLSIRVKVDNAIYRLSRVFKHDFFAVTALYELEEGPAGGVCRSAKQIVLKSSRRGDFLGLPLGWFGRWLTRHEWLNLKRLAGIGGLPRGVRRVDRHTIIYEFIPGRSLDERPELPEDYFTHLEELIRRIHGRRMVIFDLNKRGNILLTDENMPAVIDFQISCHIPRRIAGSVRLADYLLNKLQAEDFYHLNKHKRRFRPDLMNDEELQASQRVSAWIYLHRLTTRPLTRLRRRVLRHLFRQGHLGDDQTETAPENDPARFERFLSSKR